MPSSDTFVDSQRLLYLIILAWINTLEVYDISYDFTKM